MSRIPLDYYLHSDVLFLSRDLLGKLLMTCIDGVLTGGIITETEAYRGPEDKASHAYSGRRTPRNESMYARGGTCYVFRCYGIHNLFNIVTNQEEIPHAILIRAIQPVVGMETMLQRRGKKEFMPTLTSGPGSLAKALGIERHHDGISLSGKTIWIEDHGHRLRPEEILQTSRIGIDYAAEDALLPWRFVMDNIKKYQCNSGDQR